MPAATNKAELLAVSAKEYAKLLSVLEQVPVRAALLKEDDTSIKDVIAHRAHWIELFLGWYRDGQAGREVHFPAKGYKWNDLPRYNAALRDAQKDMDWQDACDALTGSHECLTEFIEGTSDGALYGAPMKGAKNKWTTGRWAEAAGPSHYRSAAKYLRRRLRAIE